MAKTTGKPGTRKARKIATKHVSISPEQRLHIHVNKGGKQVAEYIAGADPEGAVRMNLAPEAPAPVQDPSPISGT